MNYTGILKKITPDRQALLRKSARTIAAIQQEAAKKKVKCHIMLAGSLAKGTVLKQNVDCDIFVRFDYTYKDKDISKLLKPLIATFSPAVVHGSRDYYTFKKAGITYEIIPVLHITDPKDAQNVMDMSPLHVAWIVETLKKKKDERQDGKAKKMSIPQEIMLAKQFCKAAGIYGAESYVGGFSGHVQIGRAHV